MDLVNQVYDVLDSFPDNEKYGLRSQISRCVVSIPSNIAEGSGRKSEKEFARFIEIALGSSFELETQILIAKGRGFIPKDRTEEIINNLISIQKRMNGFRNTLIR